MTKTEALQKMNEIKNFLVERDFEEEYFYLDECPNDPVFCQLVFNGEFIITPSPTLDDLSISFDLDISPDFSAIVLQHLTKGGYEILVMECYWICPDCNTMYWGDEIDEHRGNDMEEIIPHENFIGNA